MKVEIFEEDGTLKMRIKDGNDNYRLNRPLKYYDCGCEVNISKYDALAYLAESLNLWAKTKDLKWDLI